MTTQRPRSPRSKPDRIGHHEQLLPVDPDLAPEDPGEPSSTHRPGRRRRSRQPLVLAAIGAGGFVGAWGRYEVSATWPSATSHFPWATFVINTSGALFLALVLTMLLGRPGAWPYPSAGGTDRFRRDSTSAATCRRSSGESRMCRLASQVS